MIISSSSK